LETWRPGDPAQIDREIRRFKWKVGGMEEESFEMEERGLGLI